MIASLAQLWDLIAHRHRAYNRAGAHAEALGADEGFQGRHAETLRRFEAGELDKGIPADKFIDDYADDCSMEVLERIMANSSRRRVQSMLLAGLTAASLTAFLFLILGLAGALETTIWGVIVGIFTAVVSDRV